MTKAMCGQLAGIREPRQVRASRRKRGALGGERRDPRHPRCFRGGCSDIASPQRERRVKHNYNKMSSSWVICQLGRTEPEFAFASLKRSVTVVHRCCREGMYVEVAGGAPLSGHCTISALSTPRRPGGGPAFVPVAWTPQVLVALHKDTQRNSGQSAPFEELEGICNLDKPPEAASFLLARNQLVAPSLARN